MIHMASNYCIKSQLFDIRQQYWLISLTLIFLRSGLVSASHSFAGVVETMGVNVNRHLVVRERGKNK